MSTITIGAVKLFNREQLNLLKVPKTMDEPHVTQRILLDDNRALDFLLLNPIAYPFFLEDAYPKTDFEEGRNHHLSRLNRNVGSNCRAILDSDLTLRRGMSPWIRDLSVYGGIRDSEEFREYTHPMQARRLLEHALGKYRAIANPKEIGGLSSIANAAGLSFHDYYQSHFFKEFLKGFVGPEDGDEVSHWVGKNIGLVDDKSTEENLFTHRLINRMLESRFTQQGINVENVSKQDLLDLILHPDLGWDDKIGEKGETLLGLEMRLSDSKLTIRDELKFEKLLMSVNQIESKEHKKQMTYRVFTKE